MGLDPFFVQDNVGKGFPTYESGDDIIVGWHPYADKRMWVFPILTVSLAH